MANYSIDGDGALLLNDGHHEMKWGGKVALAPWHAAAKQFWTQLQALNSENEALMKELRECNATMALMRRMPFGRGEQFDSLRPRHEDLGAPKRIDVIGQNGNTGEHYAYLTPDSKVVRLGDCVALSEREVELLALLSKAGVIVDQELLAEMREAFK